MPESQLTIGTLNAQAYYIGLSKWFIDYKHPRLLTPNNKWAEIFIEKLNGNKPDVFCFQETNIKLAGEILRNLRKYNPGYDLINVPGSPELLQTVYDRNKLELLNARPLVYPQRNLEIQCHGANIYSFQEKDSSRKRFDVVDIHAPSGTKRKDRKNMQQMILDTLDNPARTIICGDANSVGYNEPEERDIALAKNGFTNHTKNIPTYDLKHYEGFRRTLKLSGALLRIIGREFSYNLDIFATGRDIAFNQIVQKILPDIFFSDHAGIIGTVTI